MTAYDDRLYWVRQIMDAASVPDRVRAHAAAFEEHYTRARGLGFSEESAWERAEIETRHHRVG